MDRNTNELIYLHRATHGDETLEQQIARIRAERKTSRLLDSPPIEQTLPTRDVDLVTCTLDELHDLVYAAVSTELRERTSMTITSAQQHATRAAAGVQLLASASDYRHRGRDPRE